MKAVRHRLSMLTALSVACLSSSLRAAIVEPVSLAPVLGMTQSVPAFRAAILSNIQLVDTLSVQPIPSLAQLLVAAPTPANPWPAEAALLVGALAAQPAAIAANQNELRAALGDRGGDQLKNAAARFQARAAEHPELAAQLNQLRSGLNLSDGGAVSDLGARLDALRLNILFDNDFKARSEAVSGGAAPETAAMSAGSRGKAIHPFSRLSPYTPRDPMVRIRATAQKRLEEEGAKKEAYDKGPKDAAESTPQRLAAWTNIGRTNFQMYRRHLATLQALLEAVKRRSPKLAKEADIRLSAINVLSSDIPADLADYVIKGKYRNYNGAPASSAQAYARNSDLEERFKKLQIDEIKTPDLIRKLREDGQANDDPEIQALLRQHVADGMESLIAQVVEDTGDLQGRKLDTPVNVDGHLFSFILQGWRGVPNNYDKENSVPVALDASDELLLQLLSELVTNGNRASQRRHPIEVRPNWGIALAWTRVKRAPNGDVVIEIEDHGDPKEYTEVKGLGNSVGNGVGIGRYRSELAAAYLGYRISHAAKPDGSGSIVTITVPADKVHKE